MKCGQQGRQLQSIPTGTSQQKVTTKPTWRSLTAKSPSDSGSIRQTVVPSLRRFQSDRLWFHQSDRQWFHQSDRQWLHQSDRQWLHQTDSGSIKSDRQWFHQSDSGSIRPTVVPLVRQTVVPSVRHWFHQSVRQFPSVRQWFHQRQTMWFHLSDRPCSGSISQTVVPLETDSNSICQSVSISQTVVPSETDCVVPSIRLTVVPSVRQ